jgi:DNA-3-methyladenine glycosylase I
MPAVDPAVAADGLVRCNWATTHPLLASYHDHEWGVPLFGDDRLFEMLSLDCFQAGLSWLTILKKREAFLKAFNHFRITEVAAFTDKHVTALMADAGIVRNRLKIPAVIGNAKIAMELQQEFGSFSAYIWHFCEGRPVVNHWTELKQIPAVSPLSDAMSKDMKKRGMQFVGSTIIYAFLQSIGMVNDHLVSCHRYGAIQEHP